MAGRFIRVTSAHVSHDIEKDYTGRTGLKRASLKFWKRIVHKRQEPKYQHDPTNFWTSQHCFYLFFAVMGNGLDAMPHSMRFALKISGGLFMIYQCFFSLVISFPLLYTEMFFGMYSRLTSTQLFRMLPMSFGFCVLTLFQGILYVAMSSPAIAMMLMGTLDHLLKSKWECPGNDRMCYDYKVEGPLSANCTREHLLLTCGDRKRLVVSMHHMYEKFLQRNNFEANWYLIVVTIVTWIFVIVLVNFKMKILELLLKVFVILHLFVHLILFLLALSSEGSSTAISNLADFKFRSITAHTIILTAFFMPVKHNALYGGGYMTYAASISYTSNIGLTFNSLLLLLTNYVFNLFYMFVFHAMIGVLGKAMGLDYREVFFPFDGMYYALASEFLRLTDCPHVFISIYHLINWLLECTKLTIIIRMHLNGLYDFFPTIVQFKTHTRVGWIGICAFFGLLDTMGICVKLINAIMWMINLYMMSAFQIFIKSLLIFYGYGVSRLSDDINFHTGHSPVKFWRIVWYFYPFILVTMLATLIIDGWYNQENLSFIANDFQDHKIMKSFWIVCYIVTAVVIMGLFFISFLYVVLQMRQSMRITLMTPLFYWGPPKREDRIARKEFIPRVTIRSQKPKKRRLRYREHSVRQQHEADKAEHISRPRMFLDKELFENLNYMRHQVEKPEFKAPARSHILLRIRSKSKSVDVHVKDIIPG